MSTPAAGKPIWNKPTRHMLSDNVFENLKALVMNCTIPPGARINIDAVTRELGTSTTPVREALAKLEADGLVDKVALRGYRATELLSSTELAELYEARLLVEPWAARTAAARLDDAAAEKLAATMSDVDSAPAGTDYMDYAEFAAHDEQLHDLIMQIAGNETIRRMFARTHAHMQLFRINYGKRFGVETIGEHRALVDAIVARRARAAEAAMRAHLTAARNRFLAAP